MKSILLTLLFFVFGCSAEVEHTELSQPEIPIGLMNQKEQEMTNIILGIRHFEYL